MIIQEQHVRYEPEPEENDQPPPSSGDRDTPTSEPPAFILDA